MINSKHGLQYCWFAAESKDVGIIFPLTLLSHLQQGFVCTQKCHFIIARPVIWHKLNGHVELNIRIEIFEQARFLNNNNRDKLGTRDIR